MIFKQRFLYLPKLASLKQITIMSKHFLFSVFTLALFLIAASGEKEKAFCFPVSLPGKEELIPIRARLVKVGDESNNVKYILNIELVR